MTRLGTWAFLVSIAYVPFIMSCAVFGRWAVIALGVPLMAEMRLKVLSSVQIALVIGLTWACASLLVTPDKLDGILQFGFMICLVGVMGVASQQESLDKALEAMCFAMAINLFFSPSLPFSGDLVAQGSNGYSGLFYNCEVFVELCAPLAVWAIVKRYWWLAAGPVLPIIMNESRITMFAVAFALVIALWPKSTKHRVMVIAGAVAAFLIIVVGMTLLIDFKLSSALLRLTMWLSTFYAIDPLGHGIGWYRTTHYTEEFAHSDILQAFAELGLGALPFAVIPFVALRNRRDHAEWAAFIVICIELAVSFPLHVPASAFLAALLAGYLVRDRAVVHMLRWDGRSDHVVDDEWKAAVRGNARRRSGSGSFVFPARYSPETISPLGLHRGGA